LSGCSYRSSDLLLSCYNGRSDPVETDTRRLLAGFLVDSFATLLNHRGGLIPLLEDRDKVSELIYTLG
jgi:hypothetical protein